MRIACCSSLALLLLAICLRSRAMMRTEARATCCERRCAGDDRRRVADDSRREPGGPTHPALSHSSTRVRRRSYCGVREHAVVDAHGDPTHVAARTCGQERARVSVDGASSAPVDLVCSCTRAFPCRSAIRNSLPLTLDVDRSRARLADRGVPLRAQVAASPTTPVTAPDRADSAACGGIFASQIVGDGPTRVSGWGEDIDVAADGSIWFTQGGGPLYDGVHPNASRIVRYRPRLGQFSCFTSPVDNSEVLGVLRGRCARPRLVRGICVCRWKRDLRVRP